MVPRPLGAVAADTPADVLLDPRPASQESLTWLEPPPVAAANLGGTR
jgi:hypothetical protein